MPKTQRVFKTCFDHSPSVGIKFEKPSLTSQSFSDVCNINTIWSSYCGCPDKMPKTPLASNSWNMQSMDLVEACRIADELRTEFNLLPADVKRMFGNDPIALSRFLTDESNLPKARELGLLPKESDLNVSFAPSHLTPTGANDTTTKNVPPVIPTSIDVQLKESV